MLQVKTESKTIRGFNVTVQQFPALRAMPLGFRVGRTFGALWGHVEFARSQGKSGWGALGPALYHLVTTNPPEDLVALMREMLASTTIGLEGKVLQLDRDETLNAAFTGRLELWLDVVLYSIEVNFAHFGAALLEDAGPEEGEAESSSTSTTTSPMRAQSGSSG